MSLFICRLTNNCQIKHNTGTVATYLQKRELKSVAELNKVKEEKDTQTMMIQAALICDRVLGTHIDTLKYSHITTQLLWDVAITYAVEPDYHRTYPLWSLAFTIRSKKEDFVSLTTIAWLHIWIKFLLEVSQRKQVRPDTMFEDSFKIFKTAAHQLRRDHTRVKNRKYAFSETFEEDSERLKYATLGVVQMMGLVSSLMPNSQEERNNFETEVKQMAALDLKGPDGKTLIQMVSSRETDMLSDSPLHLFPSQKCISIITAIK